MAKFVIDPAVALRHFSRMTNLPFLSGGEGTQGFMIATVISPHLPLDPTQDPLPIVGDRRVSGSLVVLTLHGL